MTEGRRAGIALGALAVIAALGPLLSSAPRSLAWTAFGELARPRAHAAAIAISTGEVLVVGGLDPGDPEVTNPTAELVDPLTGRVTVLKDRLVGRVNHSATIAWGDRVVVAGGTVWRGDGWAPLDRVDVYLPYAKAFTRGAPLLEARSDHGAVALADGRVLVVGGNAGTRLLATTEIYEPSTDRWSSAAPMPRPRARFSIARLPDGRVLVAGGLEASGVPSRSSLLYDVRADRWSGGPSLSLARVQHATVVLPSGDVLLIGGQDAAAGSAERYDRKRGAFVPAGELAEPRLVVQAAPLLDGRALITGGVLERPRRAGWEPSVGASVWDPATNRWSAFPKPASPRALGALVGTPFGLIQLSGIGVGEAPQRSIERLVLR